MAPTDTGPKNDCTSAVSYSSVTIRRAHPRKTKIPPNVSIAARREAPTATSRLTCRHMYTRLFPQQVAHLVKLPASISQQHGYQQPRGQAASSTAFQLLDTNTLRPNMKRGPPRLHAHTAQQRIKPAGLGSTFTALGRRTSAAASQRTSFVATQTHICRVSCLR